jgi:hypothetical protein
MAGSSLAAVATLADAIKSAAVQAGSNEPSVRGADWQTAAVTAVGSDGTVTAAGIIARRSRSYADAAVGDLILLTISGSGNWVALCKLAPSDGSDAWQAPALTSPWINYVGAGGYTGARYRRYPDGDVSIEGVVASNAVSVGPTSNLFTLPANFRPAAIVVAPVLTTGNAVRQLEVSAVGLVRLTGLPVGAVTYVTIGCRFSTL